jgi:hypothetical protein
MGIARPSPKQAPSSRPRAGSPTARLTPASPQTPKERTKVVKPMPSSTPYRPAAKGIGMTRRQCSGSWRRIWGTILVPRASRVAASNAIPAATR